MATTGLKQMEIAKRELRVPSTYLHQLNKQMQTLKRHSSSTTRISKIEKSHGKEQNQRTMLRLIRMLVKRRAQRSQKDTSNPNLEIQFSRLLKGFKQKLSTSIQSLSIRLTASNSIWNCIQFISHQRLQILLQIMVLLLLPLVLFSIPKITIKALQQDKLQSLISSSNLLVTIKQMIHQPMSPMESF